MHKVKSPKSQLTWAFLNSKFLQFLFRSRRAQKYRILWNVLYILNKMWSFEACTICLARRSAQVQNCIYGCPVSLSHMIKFALRELIPIPKISSGLICAAENEKKNLISLILNVFSTHQKLLLEELSPLRWTVHLDWIHSIQLYIIFFNQVPLNHKNQVEKNKRCEKLVSDMQIRYTFCLKKKTQRRLSQLKVQFWTTIFYSLQIFHLQ